MSNLTRDTFTKGTKVHLLSGGPEMIVTGIDDEYTHVCWFDHFQKLVTAKFPHGVLREVK